MNKTALRWRPVLAVNTDVFRLGGDRVFLILKVPVPVSGK